MWLNKAETLRIEFAVRELNDLPVEISHGFGKMYQSYPGSDTLVPRFVVIDKKERSIKKISPSTDMNKWLIVISEHLQTWFVQIPPLHPNCTTKICLIRDISSIFRLIRIKFERDKFLFTTHKIFKEHILNILNQIST